MGSRRLMTSVACGGLTVGLAFGGAEAGNAPLRPTPAFSLSADTFATGASVTPAGPDGAAAVFNQAGALTLQLLTASGARSGAPIAVTGPDGPGFVSSSVADVATLKTGTLAVGWEGVSEAGSFESDIFIQLFRPNGSRIGRAIRANSKTAASQSRPRIAALPDGGFVVVWVDDPFNVDTRAIRGQAFTSTGAKVGAEFRSTVSNALFGLAVAGVTGGFLVAGQTSGEIFVQRFTGRGARVGGPKRVDAPNARVHENAAMASVAVNGKVGAVIVWVESVFTVVTNLDVRIKGALKGRFLTSAAVPGPLFSIVDAVHPDRAGSTPDVAGLGSDALVAFSSGSNPATGNEARAARIDAAGVAGPVFALNSDGSGSQTVQDVAVLGSGKPIAVFSDQSSTLGAVTLGLLGTFLTPPSVNATPIRGTPGSDRALNGAGRDDTMFGLGGDDRMSGLGGNDTLDGGAGADTLIGGFGVDLMLGGPGNDAYIVENSADRIIERVGEGTDAVASTVSYTLPANVENLTLTGTRGVNGQGNASANRMVGTEVDNALFGLGGPDRLEGRGGRDILDGGAGADVMTGGPGDDSYTVDTPGDVVVERDGEGYDTITTGASFVVPAHVEEVRVAGVSTVTGNDLANSMDGGDGPQRLRGLGGRDDITGAGGDDTLDGGGDVDFLDGGPGDDVLTGGGVGQDIFSFRAGFGNDVVTDFSPTDRDSLSFDRGIFADLTTLFAGVTIDGSSTLITAPGGGSVRLLGILGISQDDVRLQ